MSCAIPNQPNICARNLCYHQRFRTFDGSCNHLQQPMKGTVYSPYARLLQANYEDGINQMIGINKCYILKLVVNKHSIPIDKIFPNN